MSRIIVDLTEFATWSGHQTGIQRVVYGLARGLNKSKKDVRFVSFVGGQDFKEIDLKEFAKTLLPIEPINSSANVQATKTLLKKIYQKSPSFVQQHFTPARKEAIKRTLRLARSRLHSLRNIKIKKAMSQQNIILILNPVTLSYRPVEHGMIRHTSMH